MEAEAKARAEQQSKAELEPEAPPEMVAQDDESADHKAEKENKETAADAHEEAGDNLDKKETKALLSSSIRIPQNPV